MESTDRAICSAERFLVPLNIRMQKRYSSIHWLILVAAACAIAQAQSAGVKGLVLESGTNLPIAGAKVTLLVQSRARVQNQTVSGAAGEFHFDLEPGLGYV